MIDNIDLYDKSIDPIYHTNLLKFGDGISMAHSIESRLPFLDYRLVEFVFRLPVRYKFDGAQSKGILKQAMAGVIPERIRSRRDKVGFVTPTSRWLRRRLDSDVRPLLLSQRSKSRGILNVRNLDPLLTEQALRWPTADATVFRLLSVELWFQLFIDGEGKPERLTSPARLAAPGAA